MTANPNSNDGTREVEELLGSFTNTPPSHEEEPNLEDLEGEEEDLTENAPDPVPEPPTKDEEDTPDPEPEPEDPAPGDDADVIRGQLQELQANYNRLLSAYMQQQQQPTQEQPSSKDAAPEAASQEAVEEALASLDIDDSTLEAIFSDPAEMKQVLEKVADVATKRAEAQMETKFDELAAKRDEKVQATRKVYADWVSAHEEELKQHKALHTDFLTYVNTLEEANQLVPGREREILDATWEYTKRRAAEWAARFGVKPGSGSDKPKAEQPPSSVAPTPGGSSRGKPGKPSKTEVDEVSAVLGNIKNRGTFGVM